MNERQDNTEGLVADGFLIVEDSLIQAELLRRIPVREGCRITLAKDGVLHGARVSRSQPRPAGDFRAAGRDRRSPGRRRFSAGSRARAC